MLEREFDEAVEATPQQAPAGPAVPRPRDAGPLPHRIRHRFPIFERLVYVNSCSQGALSDSVRQSYADYLRDWDDRGSPWDYWVEQTERARASFAGLVNAAPDEIAVTSSVSEGVSAIATGLRYGGRRNKIVLTDYEFPTVGQIFHAQESRGARVVHVPPAADGTIPIEGFERAIDDETLLVGMPMVSYRTGTMLDVERITQLAHERGALVLLDAYQAAGSVPIDVKALGVDVLGAGALKYLLGSAGLAFLYCRAELVERFWPTSTGWFADRDIFEMDHRDYSPASTAARFQSGTPNVPSIYAGVAGIELMKEIGVQETRDHVLGLNSRLIEGLDELRVKIVTPRRPKRRGALICVASYDAPALVATLRREGIVTSERDSNHRISAHCYNAVEDVDAVLESLARHRRLLVRANA
jgi:selenocysteine lyase/cysteine desulfurase